LGGESCWEAISGDTIYITILAMLEMKEIFNRIFRLIPNSTRKLDENNLVDGALIVGGAKLVEFMAEACPSVSY
jgi:hypothetical protein